ncbi:hypothetical protein RB195_005269 [Necator americanus]|uniref:Uncharacterized protein n=1 Tax=Necator americanus TaxID=51031 RepID=A0ABR1BNL5_NECAM
MMLFVSHAKGGNGRITDAHSTSSKINESQGNQGDQGGKLLNGQSLVLGQLSCCFKWIIFEDCLQQVVVKFRRAAATFLIFKAHIATTKPLEPTRYHGFGGASLTPNSVDIPSCLRCRPAQLELVEEEFVKILTGRIIFLVLVLTKL